MKKNKKEKVENRIKAIKLAVKINFYVAMLILAYFLLGIVILRGGLFKIEPILYSLFYINCFVVGLKLYKNGRGN